MIRRERIPHPGGASFSSAVVVDAGGARTIHVAGQTLRAAEGVPEDLGAQTEACLRKVEAILEQAGATLADVVTITIYLTDLADYARVAEARARVFGDDLPASAAVGVASLLGDAAVEITATAICDAPAGA